MDALLILLCLIPSLLILVYVYVKDKIEKEPFSLLMLLFIGGVIAFVISFFISIVLKETIPFLKLNYMSMNILQIIFKFLIVISFVEECTKWIFTYITVWENKNFNYMYDSIVYSVFTSLGFATIENIFYGLSFSSYGLFPIIIRGLCSVPSHAVFGIFMGYYLGVSKHAFYQKKNYNKYKFLSLIVPVLLHFFYNLLLIKSSTIYYFIFVIYIIILYIFAFFKIKKISLLSKKITKK